MVNVNIEVVNINASQDLITHMTEMFQGIDKYNDQITAIDIYIKSHPETVDGEKEIEAKVFLPGENIFVSKTGDSFTTAAQHVYDTLKVSLNKRKDMLKDRHIARPDKQAI